MAEYEGSWETLALGIFAEEEKWMRNVALRSLLHPFGAQTRHTFFME